MRFGKIALREIGLEVLGINDRDISYDRFKCIFKSHFGCSLSMVFQLWNIMDSNDLIPDKGKPMHLFWSLSYLKTYDYILNYSVKYLTSEKTFRKWVTEFIQAISKINLVRLNPEVVLTQKINFFYFLTF
jgi:hypothetical protein